MKIGIFGSGSVGKRVGAKLVELGHEVMIGTRDPAKMSDWLAEQNGQAKAGSAAETAAFGELLINATLGAASLEVLRSAGASLAGKVLIDISNPLDFSQGSPPVLFVSSTDSLGAQIQRAFPDVKVVKTLNTVTARLMVNPDLLNGGDHTMFLCGNDGEAKEQVKSILKDWFGWRDVIDLGDITSARLIEMILPLWVRLYMEFQNPLVSFKVVR